MPVKGLSNPHYRLLNPNNPLKLTTIWYLLHFLYLLLDCFIPIIYFCFIVSLKLNKMHNEKINKWTSHKHPNNPNFMQVVKYMHVEYSDGRNNLYWSLFNSSPNDKHVIRGITLLEAQTRFMDVEDKEITEEDFNTWMLSRNV